MLQSTRSFQVSTTCNDSVEVATITKIVNDCGDDKGVSITETLVGTCSSETNVSRNNKVRILCLHTTNCFFCNPEAVLINDVSTFTIIIARNINFLSHNLTTPQFNTVSSCRRDYGLTISRVDCSSFHRERLTTVKTECDIKTFVYCSVYGGGSKSRRICSGFSDDHLVQMSVIGFTVVPSSTNLERCIAIVVIVSIIRTDLRTVHEHLSNVRCTGNSDVIPGIDSCDGTSSSDMVTSTSTITERGSTHKECWRNA